MAQEESKNGTEATTEPSVTTTADKPSTTVQSTPTTAAKPSGTTMRNTNRWDTRTLVTMALLAAIGALLSFIEGGNFGGFLDYDASFVPAMIGGFVFGPVSGFVIGLITWVIHGLVKADLWGSIMNIVAVALYVIPAALIYKQTKTRKGAIIGLAVGTVCTIIAMIAMNLVITPIYTGMPAFSNDPNVYSVAQMIVPLLLPFNVCKALANSILTYFLYKPVSNMVRPVKEQKHA